MKASEPIRQNLPPTGRQSTAFIVTSASVQKAPSKRTNSGWVKKGLRGGGDIAEILRNPLTSATQTRRGSYPCRGRACQTCSLDKAEGDSQTAPWPLTCITEWILVPHTVTGSLRKEPSLGRKDREFSFENVLGVWGTLVHTFTPLISRSA